jgi:hypothetical protein
VLSPNTTCPSICRDRASDHRKTRAKLRGDLQVCLQNCHLAESDLLALANLVQSLSHRVDVHPAFRLWLTMAASPIIPTSITAAGHTVVLEPPRGFRARLQHTLHTVPDDVLQPVVPNGTTGSDQMRHKLWIQTVLAVAMYHAAICEVCVARQDCPLFSVLSLHS